MEDGGHLGDVAWRRGEAGEGCGGSSLSAAVWGRDGASVGGERGCHSDRMRSGSERGLGFMSADVWMREYGVLEVEMK